MASFRRMRSFAPARPLRAARIAWPLVPMACRSVLPALRGGPGARSPVLSTMAPMSSMAAMPEHMHGDEGNGD